MTDAAPDLADDPRAIAVRKRPLPVRVAFAGEDGVCQTREGPVAYRAGDALLTGVKGERWPVAAAPFRRSYRPLGGVRAGADGDYVKRPADVLALRLDAPMTVRVGWQRDPLRGAAGDWLLDYRDGTHGIVGDAIFRESYEPVGSE